MLHQTGRVLSTNVLDELLVGNSHDTVVLTGSEAGVSEPEHFEVLNAGTIGGDEPSAFEAATSNPTFHGLMSDLFAALHTEYQENVTAECAEEKMI